MSELDRMGAIVGGIALLALGTLVLVELIPATQAAEVPTFLGMLLVVLGMVLLVVSHRR